jgi:hypothetical protein
MMNRTWRKVNRAFSANSFGIPQIPGALPQAQMNAAPLALRALQVRDTWETLQPLASRILLPHGSQERYQ